MTLIVNKPYLYNDTQLTYMGLVKVEGYPDSGVFKDPVGNTREFSWDQNGDMFWDDTDEYFTVTPTQTSLLGKYCLNCDHTYFSRSTHDFACCPCWIESKHKTGGYIDGGRAYVKCGGQGVLVRLTLDQTEYHLYEDWNSQVNQYGLLKGKHGVELINELTPLPEEYR